MTYFKRILFILALSFFIYQLVDLVPQNRDKPSDSELANQDQNIEQRMIGVRLREIRNDEKNWTLKAKSADTLKKSGKWTLYDVEVTVFGKEKETYIIEGDTGKVEVDSSDIEIHGNVEMNSTKGYQFMSDDMIYNDQLKEILSDTPVKMKGPKDVNGDRIYLEGKKMRSEIDTNLMYVEGDVITKKLVKRSVPMRIESQKAWFDGNNNGAEFQEDVFIQYTNMKMKGKKAVMAYNRQENLVTNVQVEGNVEMQDQNKKGFSDRVDMDLIQKKYVMRGKPKVQQGQDVLVGKEIHIFDNGNKIHVIGAKANIKEGGPMVIDE